MPETLTLPARLETACALTIESAQVEGAKRRIRGTANTFRVMRSGRIMHPGPMEALTRATGGRVNLPLLAQHGMVPGFATIGRIDTLKVVGDGSDKRLHFEAELVSGTGLAEEAWALLQQKALASLSIGWIAKQARWVRASDTDIDPWLHQKLTEAGAEEAYAFLDWELVEISVVDVPDDGGAKLAAKLLDDLRVQLQQPGADAGDLRAEVARLRADVDAIRAAGSPAAVEILESLGEAFTEWRERFVDSCVEALETDAGVAQAAADRAGADDLDADAALEAAALDTAGLEDRDSDFERLRQMLRDTSAGR